ncbi:MAG TPA: EAL domain-containing protein [Vicinamibacterales bacterium]|jgi:diguanylate cyclase (GGDEF)-like protein/PAS domain S-box-containing protein|nr:EAL domain-containing protein [Vicinamibacterales bacterium]
MLGPFENAFTHAPIGMALVDMADRFLRVNNALCRITGFTADELCARSFRDLSDPHDVDLDASQMAELLGGHIPTYHVEKRYRHAWGHQVWVLLSVSLIRNDAGRAQHIIAQVQDITERKALEGRLEQLVDHDFLTALFNARRFEQALAQETKSAARYGSSGGAVLLLDLDHFKAVNDEFGHKAGDDLLKTVAAALGGRIRETDVLARLGGDEFGIILPHVDAEQAEVVADGIVKALRRQTAMLAEHQIPVTASVGVALFDGLTHIEILAAADLAMYEAKEAGRDRFALYRPLNDAPVRLSSRLAEAERIQRALTHDQLELYCQPILDLANNEVSQYELLLRLRTDSGDLLPPSAFLYVAERFGTILSIDCWVVQQAVALIATHAKAGRSLTLHLNISAKSIGHPELVTVIERALADAHIDPACLVFELTETAAIGNIDHAKTFTTELRSRGCRFALDDFGSGFGSFYYLKHLPFDYFKIDGDFIRGFGANTTDQLVVEAIVGIARGMGKKTVAEFVADQDMTDRLRRSGIDYAQGFHIGMPRPIVETFAQTISA